MHLKFVVRVLLLAVSCASLACNSSSSGAPLTPTSKPPLNIQDITTSASGAGGDAVLRNGVAPPSSGGPTPTVTGNNTVVNGGTLSVNVTAGSPFTTIYVFVGGKALGLAGEDSGGIGGYYEIHTPAPVTSDTVLLTFPQEIPLSEFELLFAVATSSGAVSPYVPISIRVASVGTGDVQVTLSWDVDSDVDLHVVDPAGEEVFYAHRRSASGGELDLDSNPACAFDHIRNENITWPVGRAPRGRYTVRVDYWASCGVEQSNYTVRVNNSGGASQIVSGSFTGLGDQGGAGSGRTVATFERLTGPAASSVRVSAPVPDSVSKTFKTPAKP